MRNLLFIILTVTGFYSNAQLQTAHWYFGQYAGIDFITGEAEPGWSFLSTGEGSASISDECGNLLFYTNGVRVYTQNHALMPNGNGLNGGVSSYQSSIIVPHPGNSNLYYIFTTDSFENINHSKGLNYSLVNMSLGDYGEVVLSEKNIPLPLNGEQVSYENITGVANADGSGYWVITHYRGSFFAFSITSGGVNPNPVISSSGIFLDHQIVPFVVFGTIKASPDGSKIARAYPYTSQNSGTIGLYDFDNATGVVSNERLLYSSNSTDIRQYISAEFSPNGQILYGATYQGLFQYDITSENIIDSEQKIAEYSSMLLRGLDDKIYGLGNGTHLSVIQNPNQLYNPITGEDPEYLENDFYLGGRNHLAGLPNFITTYYNEKVYFIGDIFVNGSFDEGQKFCLGEEVTLGSSFCGLTIETYLWGFGDGNTSSEQNPVHTYDNPGTYTVTLIVTAPGGQSNTFTIEVEIVPPPDAQNAELKECLDLNGNSVEFDLTESYPQINPNGENLTITFYETEQEAENGTNPPLPTIYTTAIITTLWVRAENEWGCVTVVQLNLLFHELPELTIESPEVEICTNSSIELSVGTSPENEIYWYDSATGTTPIYIGNPFETPVLTMTTSYWVEIISEENCPSERQEIIVIVADEITPQFTQIAPICFGEEFELPAESLNGITGIWTPAIDNTQTTEYTFTPDPDQCSTQPVQMTVEVIQTPEITLPSLLEICSGETVSITITTTGETLNWYENEFDTTPFFTGLIFSEELTETTTFWLEAQTGNCLSERVSFTVTVNPLPIIESEISNPVCEGNPVELSVITNGNIVNWYESETSINVIFTGNPFTTPNLTETTIYWVEAVSEDNCKSERIPVTATVLDETIPEFNFDLEYCLNSEEIILPTTSDNGISGTWFPAIINTNNLGTTIYEFTPDLECGETITRSITIVEIILPEFDDLIQNYCLNSDEIQTLPNLSDNGISGTWFPNQINTNIQGTTTYTFIPDDGQCSEPYPLNVTVFPHPDMDLEEELLICEGDSFTYTAPDGFDSYEWKNEQNQIISQSQTVTFTQEGIYTLTVEINGIPCDLSRSIEVRFSTPPTITEIKTTENTLTVYATGGNPLEYSMNQVFWQSSPTFTNLQPGIYHVYVRDAKGCSTTAKQAGLLGASNFISPNGDGYNDTWEIRGLEAYPNTRLQIFDRYGKIFVDRMIDSTFSWDGKYNSQPLPSGSYWYILILESGEKISGHIALRNH